MRSVAFSLQNVFKYGYRNKEDVSNLPPNVLVVGSQNVVTSAADVVSNREGYVLDGAAGTQNDYGTDSNYDFQNRLGSIRNLRKWGTNLEVRYVNPETDAVSWINIIATLQAANVANFTDFWDQLVELKKYCLFVNGDNNIYQWTGGVGSYASSTAAVAGTLATVVVSAGGSGYTVGDILAVAGGSGGTVRVVTVSGGVITSIAIQNPGSGYSASSGVALSGGTGTLATITTTIQAAGTLTVSGTLTTSQLGFYDNASNLSLFKLLDQNGNTYTYTSVSNETFLGVFPDPSAAFTVGDPVLQKPSSITGAGVATNGGGNMGTAFHFDLIGTLENQVWYGDKSQNNAYVSKTNDYKSVVYSTPARLPAEGALIVLDGPPVAFSVQANQMYIGAGTDQWWISQKLDQTIDVAGVATPTQVLYASRLKTAFNQAPQSQALTARYKNSLVYVSNEPIINALGLVQNIQQDPQVVNLSDPIKLDIDAYDFTGGCVFYDNYYLYVAVPRNNVVRMYNVQKNYWEAPQTIPVSRFYHVLNSNNQTELYGHSSVTNESYQLFTGYNDNGNPINAVAAFPYICTQGGSPDMLKSFNRFYTEGYISANTQLLLETNYDFGGFSGTYGVVIDGADSKLIFNRLTDGSLGRNTLGSQPIGQILNLPFTPVVPKFRSIKTMPRQEFFEYQPVYSTNQVDAQWTLLRFGPEINGAQAIPVSITE